jgi:CheY-like chemotaxis protein
MLTARMLREAGYHVSEARSAGQAWERLAEAPEIEVVLTDIAMPGGSGLDLAERIHASAPSPRVILMSGYNRLFPQLGTSGAKFPLLVKPFTPAQLVQQIRAALLGGQH